MRAYQPGAAVTSTEVTGQSGQSELRAVGEHRPGGPATAEPEDLMRPAQQPEAEAELGLGCGHVTHMAGLDGGHGWDNARHAMRDERNAVD